MVKLVASILAAFIYQAIHLSEGRLEDEKESIILDNIVPDIVA